MSPSRACVVIAVSFALLMVPFASAGEPKTIPPWPLNDQVCAAAIGDACTFNCSGGSPFILFGIGLPGAQFTMSCGGLEIGCTTTMWEPVCGVDGTGLFVEDGKGTCTSSGPAVLIACYAWP